MVSLININDIKKYYFVPHSEVHSHNVSFLLFNRWSQQFWFGKINRHVKMHHVHFIDFPHRAILAFRLSKICCEPVAKSKLINEQEISASNEKDLFFSKVQQEKGILYDPNNILISKYAGIPLNDFLELNNGKIERIKNLDMIIKNFVFNLWVGNYDKKNNDYVVNNKGFCYSIDYDLCGPGFIENNRLSLGANAARYNLESTAHTGCCVGEKLLNYIKVKKLDLNYFKNKITEIQNIQLRKDIIKNLSLYKDNYNNHDFPLSLSVYEVLVYLENRKEKLLEAINKWIEEGYPREQNQNPSK